MSRISQRVLDQIKSNILRVLYDEAPKALSARQIALQELRDKEFVLVLLQDMEKARLVKNVSAPSSRRKQWVMTDTAYKKYTELL